MGTVRRPRGSSRRRRYRAAPSWLTFDFFDATTVWLWSVWTTPGDATPCRWGCAEETQGDHGRPGRRWADRISCSHRRGAGVLPREPTSHSWETHREAGLRAIYDGFLAVAHSPLPTLAAVNGAAVGAGVNLALACDVRIAGAGARFDCRFLDLGIHPGGGHTWMLRRIVGTRPRRRWCCSVRFSTPSPRCATGWRGNTPPRRTWRTVRSRISGASGRSTTQGLPPRPPRRRWPRCPQSMTTTGPSTMNSPSRSAPWTHHVRRTTCGDAGSNQLGLIQPCMNSSWRSSHSSEVMAYRMWSSHTPSIWR